MMTESPLRIFIPCAPGLESILGDECAILGLNAIKRPGSGMLSAKEIPGEDSGGIECEGSLADVYRCNLTLRTASRVLIRLGEFHAAAFSELRKKAGRLPWEMFLKSDQSVMIRTTCHKSRLYHSDAVTERVLGAINDHFSVGGKPSPQARLDPHGQLILVRLVNDMCTISIDSSGDLLHRRGYRQAVAKAPLRETLAAAIISLSGWDGTSSVIDPFCGSGTIPIESALISCNVPPGWGRRFRFMSWGSYSRDSWESIYKSARDAIKESQCQIMGFDRDAGAIEMATANAVRARQSESIIFRCQAVSYLMPPSSPGWIITNPPYGGRISEGKDLRDLYASFGNILRERFQAWRVAVLSSDDKLLGNLGIGKPQSSHRLINGGIAVKLECFTII